MNILQVQDRLKGLSEQQLAQEMQMPSGVAPQYLVLTELQRRKRVRDDFQAQSAQAPTTTVAQDAVAAAGVPQAGIAPMAQALAPKTDVTQNTGIAALAPQAAPEPQRMADGGIVRKMAEGRAVYTDPAIIAMANRMGMTVENYLKSLGPSAALVQQQAEQRAVRNRMMATEPADSMATYRSVNPSYVEDTTPRFPVSGDSEPGPMGMTYGTPLLSSAPKPNDIYELTGSLLGDAAGVVAPYVGVETSLLPPEQPKRPQDMTINELQAQAQAAQPGLGELGVDTAEGLMNAWATAGSWTNRKLGDALSYMGMPEYASSLYDTADREAGIPERLAAAEAEREAAYVAAAKPFEDELARRGGATELQNPKVREALISANEAAATNADPAAPVADPAPTAPVAEETPQGGGSGGGGGVGGVAAGGSGPMSDYEKAIADALARADKRANQDKWLAVAQAGMALMSSKQPTLGGALGEAGMLGVGAYRDSRDAAEKTKMDLLNTQFQIDMERQKMALARAEAASRGSGGGGKPMAAAMVKYLADERNAISDQLSALPPIEPAGWFSDEYDPAAAERKRLADALQVAEQSLAYARATYGLPSYLAPDEEEFNAADE